MMNLHLNNDRYILTDTELEHGGEVKYTVSSTCLFTETRGHAHEEQDEVYIFTSAENAEMVIGSKTRIVRTGNIVYVPKGVFHKVINKSNNPCMFYAIFQGKALRPA